MPSIVTSIRFTDKYLAKALDGFEALSMEKPTQINDIIRQTFLAGLHVMGTTNHEPSQESLEYLKTLTTQKSRNPPSSPVVAPIISALSGASGQTSPNASPQLKFDLTLTDVILPSEQPEAEKIIHMLNTSNLTLANMLTSTNPIIARLTSEMFYPIRETYPDYEELIISTYNKTHNN